MNRAAHTFLVAAGAAALLAAGNAQAAPSAAQLRYQQERADCMNGTSGQDRATCLREASAALQEARRGNLQGGDVTANALARCEGLPDGDRQDCVLRVQGAGQSSGSVRGGGIVRELSRPAGTN